VFHDVNGSGYRTSPHPKTELEFQEKVYPRAVVENVINGYKWGQVYYALHVLNIQKRV
jgi:hypothetical protein